MRLLRMVLVTTYECSLRWMTRTNNVMPEKVTINTKTCTKTCLPIEASGLRLLTKAARMLRVIITTWTTT